MSHVTYEGVMAHVNEFCHVWTRRGTYFHLSTSLLPRRRPYGTSSTNESCRKWWRHGTHKWVMSHRHESQICHASQTWLIHQSCLTHSTGTNSTQASADKVMPHEYARSHCNTLQHTRQHTATHCNTLPHTNTPSHVWMSHITHKRVVSHKAYLNEACHISMRHATHGYVVTPTFIHRHQYPPGTPLHITYESAISHINTACHIGMRRITYDISEEGMSRKNGVCVMSHTIDVCVMSHTIDVCVMSCTIDMCVMSHNIEACHTRTCRHTYFHPSTLLPTWYTTTAKSYDGAFSLTCTWCFFLGI